MEVKHTTIRNQKLFCLNCGGEFNYKIQFATNKMNGWVEAFDVLHKDCEKIWVQPKVDKTESVENKMWFWLNNGEHGLSSKVMFQKFSGISLDVKLKNHPLDIYDFKRCFYLFETIPEWKPRIHELREISETWNNLVDNWNELTDLLLEQMKTGEANGMYELMKKLGC